jgi:hypothetical protein
MNHVNLHTPLYFQPVILKSRTKSLWPSSPIWNPHNQTKTGVTIETVLSCVWFRLNTDLHEIGVKHRVGSEIVIRDIPVPPLILTVVIVIDSDSMCSSSLWLYQSFEILHFFPSSILFIHRFLSDSWSVIVCITPGVFVLTVTGEVSEEADFSEQFQSIRHYPPPPVVFTSPTIRRSPWLHVRMTIY